MGLWGMQRSIRMAGWYSRSAMAWKLGRRFKAGNGQKSDFCQMFGRFFVHGNRMTLRMEICENLRYNSIVESEQQIGFCQSVIEDEIMVFENCQFHKSNYEILHMQKDAIASQEKHIKIIQF